MDSGGGPSRDENDVLGGSGVSRRHFVVGGLFAVAGTSRLVDGGTTARFTDSGSASGTVQIDGDPTLNYLLADYTQNQKAQWEIHYQVEWVADFDHIEIYLDNNVNGSPDPPGQESEQWTNLTNNEGMVTSDSYGGHAGETWEFIFRVYDTSGNLVIEEITTDDADGTNQEQGDFGNTNDTKLSSSTVIDDATNNKANYTVEYELTNIQSDFQDVLVTFSNQTQTGWGDATRTSTSTPSGSVSYSKGGTGGDTYEISVEVRNTNGLVVDSHIFTDEVDGNNQSWSA